MSDDQKPKPLEDLKEGLGLLFRAAKGAVEKLPTEKVEDVAKDAVKQVGSAFETIGTEVDKLWNKATGTSTDAAGTPAAPPPTGTNDATNQATEEKKPEEHYDDAYAPEPPPKGPRIG